jgi:hypothetical protein
MSPVHHTKDVVRQKGYLSLVSILIDDNRNLIAGGLGEEFSAIMTKIRTWFRYDHVFISAIAISRSYILASHLETFTVHVSSNYNRNYTEDNFWLYENTPDMS